MQPPGVHLILTQLELDFASNSLDVVLRAIDTLAEPPAEHDLLVLPERWFSSQERHAYEHAVERVARHAGCAVVGGSHHQQVGKRLIHRGLCVDQRGAELGWYEKLRPYASERAWVEPGTLLGEIRLGELELLVLVCADFWFSDLILQADALPDLLLVPALSVSRKSTPDYSRELWRHLAVSRAYEFGTLVGVADWAHTSRLPQLRASGVGGLADASGNDPEQFFKPIRGPIERYPIDLPALKRFREDRGERGFFWKRTSTRPASP